MTDRKNATVVFENVTKVYGQSTVVSNINFDVDSGDLFTLLGPSGCGKTTTLRMIAGLELPSSGKIFVGGEDVSFKAAAERSVGMVFQSYALFPHMSVMENVCYGLLSAGIKKEKARERAREALEKLGMETYTERYPSELSGGQQQRIAIARSIVTNPKVLLFDEPLSNLDAKLRRQVREDIRKIQKDLGITSVYVTHDQGEALAISDKIIVMEKGEIRQIGTPHELYNNPVDRFVADFIGDTNLVVARAVGEQVLEINGYQIASNGMLEVDNDYELSIRPNALMLHYEMEESLKGLVLTAVFLGTHKEYTVELDNGQRLFVMSYDFSSLLLPGSQVSITVDPRGVSVIQGR